MVVDDWQAYPMEPGCELRDYASIFPGRRELSTDSKFFECHAALRVHVIGLSLGCRASAPRVGLLLL